MNNVGKNLIIKSLRIDWNKISVDSYLRKIPALSRLESMDFSSGITFFEGSNGSGKSTLLEAIAVSYGFNPEGGTKNANFNNFYDLSELHNAVILAKGSTWKASGYFFRAESFFNLSSYMDETDRHNPYGPTFGKELHNQSHGESFLNFINHYCGRGLYILDEPEAALSPQNQLAVLCRIAEMAKEGSQFIIATHSPILLGIPDAQIMSFSEEGIAPCQYERTQSYVITKAFLCNRERMLKEILADI